MPHRTSTTDDPNEAAFRGVQELIEQSEGKNPAAVVLGRLGGLKGGAARAAKLSAKKRSAIAKKGRPSTVEPGQVGTWLISLLPGPTSRDQIGTWRPARHPETWRSWPRNSRSSRHISRSWYHLASFGSVLLHITPGASRVCGQVGSLIPSMRCPKVVCRYSRLARRLASLLTMSEGAATLELMILRRSREACLFREVSQRAHSHRRGSESSTCPSWLMAAAKPKVSL